MSRSLTTELEEEERFADGFRSAPGAVSDGSEGASPTTIDPMETTSQADQITALRVALGAGPHADAPSPDELEPYGPDEQLPEGAARALEARAPELAERARRLGLI